MLGRHSSRVLYNLHDLWVYFDVKVAPVCQPSVSLLYLGPDPIGEWLSDHRAANVDDPLQGIQTKSYIGKT